MAVVTSLTGTPLGIPEVEMTGDSGAGVIDAYESWMRSWGAAKKTIEARKTLAARLLRDWGLSGFTTEHVSAFLEGPQPPRKPWSKWTRTTYHGHLTDFCAWLAANGHIAEDPMGEVRSPKRPRPNPRPLTEPEARRVLSVVEGRTRDWLLLAMLAGLRVSEIAKVRGEDVTADGIYVEGKGGVEAMLPCHADLWAMAQRYPRQGFWFPGSDEGHLPSQQISLVVGKLFSALGIDGSIHRGRHYYATSLLRNGANVRKVQKLMRHANLETTASYAAVDEDELRDAINLLPSLDQPA